MSQEKPSSHDSAMGWVILAVVFFLIMLLLWHFQGENIRNAVRYLRLAEMWVVSWFIDANKVVYSFNGQNFTFDQIRTLSRETPKEQLTPEALELISTVALEPFRYIFTGIMVICGLLALMRGPKSQYRQRYDINTLLRRQSGNFPYIQPFVKFNPGNQEPRPPGAPVPADLPSFAEALGPEEWVAYHSIPVPDGKLDEEVAARAFAKQLGGPWRGPLKLPAYKQILLAAFCLKAQRKRNDSDAMLGALSACWSQDKGLKVDGKLLREARRVLKDKDKISRVISRCNQHAYENTALIRALQIAREEGGVLAPAQFVWLRGFDRALWYPLNNLGRQAFHTEALGAMAQFKAEKLTSRPIPRPKMEDAVKNLAEYMSSPNARPIPTLDYGTKKPGSKKRGVKKIKGSK